MKNIWIGGCNDRIWAGGEWGGGGGREVSEDGEGKTRFGKGSLSSSVGVTE